MKRKLVTSDTFEQVKRSSLFFEYNILNNSEFDGVVELEDINDGRILSVEFLKKRFNL